MDALADSIQRVRNSMKINDWNAISGEFEPLIKLKDRTMKLANLTSTPNMYIRYLGDLEDFMNEKLADKEGKKKLSSTNSKSLNAMKQKLRKYNRDFAADLEEYRENPEMYADPESESDSDSDSDGAPGWANQRASDDSDDSDGDAKPRNRWLVSGKGDEKKSAAELAQERREKKERRAAAEGGKKKDADTDDAEAKKKEEEDKKKWTEETVDKKVAEIMANRGKKATKTEAQIEELEKLVPHAKSLAQSTQIRMHILSCRFDMNSAAKVRNYLPADTWNACAKDVNDLLGVLEANPHLVIRPAIADAGLADSLAKGAETETEESSTKAKVAAEAIKAREDADASAASAAKAAGSAEPIYLVGSIASYVERLDDELFKALQAIDHHTEEYVKRLGDDTTFIAVVDRSREYLLRVGQLGSAAIVSLRRLEHTYYKLDAATNDDRSVLFDSLSKFIFKHGDERTKLRAMLCSIYRLALHDEFFEARDMMLMSHLQDSIHNADLATQVLYNRTLAQLGLCAFRAGMVWEAHSALSELCSSGRVKELLAQGMTSRYNNSTQRFTERTPDQEEKERRRQVPCHMHLSLELLEAVHLSTAMLLEIPNLACHAFDSRRRVISKTFRRFLEHGERQIFCGAPENVRDHLVAASRALQVGDWKECDAILRSMSTWDMLQPLGGEDVKDKILGQLTEQVKEEALRTYLFTYSPQYDSISMAVLKEMFDLPEQRIHSIVSKMMIAEDLRAFWDEATQCVVMHKVEPSRVQFLALQLAEKSQQLVENNERLLDQKTGNSSWKNFEEGKGDNKGKQRRATSGNGRSGAHGK